MKNETMKSLKRHYNAIGMLFIILAVYVIGVLVAVNTFPMRSKSNNEILMHIIIASLVFIILLFLVVSSISSAKMYLYITQKGYLEELKNDNLTPERAAIILKDIIEENRDLAWERFIEVVSCEAGLLKTAERGRELYELVMRVKKIKGVSINIDALEKKVERAWDEVALKFAENTFNSCDIIQQAHKDVRSFSKAQRVLLDKYEKARGQISAE